MNTQNILRPCKAERIGCFFYEQVLRCRGTFPLKPYEQLQEIVSKENAKLGIGTYRYDLLLNSIGRDG